MSVFRLTDVSNRDRESKAYWDARVEREWSYPLHGLFGAAAGIEERVSRMDARNLEVIRGILDRIKNPSVLEAACGFGRYVPYVRHWCAEYTGIDIADKNVEEARRLNSTAPISVDFRVADMTTFDTYARFDLIFMVSAWSSIEHKSDEAIRHLKTLLKPAGKIAVFEESLYMVIER